MAGHVLACGKSYVPEKAKADREWHVFRRVELEIACQCDCAEIYVTVECRLLRWPGLMVVQGVGNDRRKTFSIRGPTPNSSWIDIIFGWYPSDLRGL